VLPPGHARAMVRAWAVMMGFALASVIIGAAVDSLAFALAGTAVGVAIGCVMIVRAARGIDRAALADVDGRQPPWVRWLRVAAAVLCVSNIALGLVDSHGRLVWWGTSVLLGLFAALGTRIFPAAMRQPPTDSG
jgi:hypothetical protein